MKSKNEKSILLIIKYSPPLFIITLSIFISLTLFINKQNSFKEEKKQIEKEYIKRNKEIIKHEVNNVYEYIIAQQKQTEEKLKENLKSKVNEAYQIAMNIYKQNKHLGKEKVQKMIKDALRAVRFNKGRGYFFIYSFDYKCILLPIASNLEGSSFYNYKDGKGTFLTRNIINDLKEKKEDFYEWWYHKPSDMKNQYKKIGFNKYFEPYNWFIGTGEYIDDFEEDIKEDVLKQIQTIKFSKDGYIFILDINGKYLSHVRKNLLGSNGFDNKETINTFNTIIRSAKNKDNTYVTYIQTRKPGTEKSVKKTSYIKNISNWNWIIGKGFYEDDANKVIEKKKNLLEQQFKKNLNNLIITSILLTFILLFISIYISKLLEKRFTKYQKEIQQNLEELTKQHNILAQQSKMAAIGEMIANIAHQWRQPLSTISTAATGLKLKKEIADLSDEEFNESLDYINKSTQYLSKTIDDFRNFFSKNQEISEFYIEEAFHDALNIVSSQFKNKGIEIFKNYTHTKISGIKSELIQVLINILNNSRDELIKIENKKLIFIDTREENGHLIITIKDNAGGIKKENLEHLFEPYFTTKHKGQGTGIGLYMSQEIIVKHLNGSININNIEYEYEYENFKGAITTIKLDI